MKFRRLFDLKGREEEVFDFITKHLDLTILAVEYLYKSMEYLKMKDAESFEKNYSEIDRLETRADEIQREIVSRICEGAFFGGIREDLLNLLEKVDNIADSAKDAAKILKVRRLGDHIMSHLFENDDLFEYLLNCTLAVRKVKEVISGLRKGKDAALEPIKLVEEYEEKADDIKTGILKRIFERADQFDVLSVVQIQNFINIADNIADNAEDATDIVLILIAKGYS